mmetsp:Transcript_74095/g.176491  ORF Transcript_74095/g.176491 Transcript_74095/m.176491 type:complete len:202 (+) Transcript_74095:1300-1905(+)
MCLRLHWMPRSAAEIAHPKAAGTAHLKAWRQARGQSQEVYCCAASSAAAAAARSRQPQGQPLPSPGSFRQPSSVTLPATTAFDPQHSSVIDHRQEAWPPLGPLKAIRRPCPYAQFARMCLRCLCQHRRVSDLPTSRTAEHQGPRHQWNGCTSFPQSSLAPACTGCRRRCSCPPRLHTNQSQPLWQASRHQARRSQPSGPCG